MTYWGEIKATYEANGHRFAYAIKRRNYRAYVASWLRFDEERGEWGYCGHVGSSFDGYATEANAMRGIRKHAARLGFEI